MKKAQQIKFDSLYQQHLNALKRQGKSDSTIDLYARAVRRIAGYFDRCPDRLTKQDLETYFDDLIKKYSWSTIRIDRNGLQFFYKHVLQKEFGWINLVKPPETKTLPDILSQAELQRILASTREARYQAFFFTAYSMGLRLGEALNLKVGDIDADNMRIHIRNGKGGKDRFVILPAVSLVILRQYWQTHRNAQLLFPAGKDVISRKQATSPMPRRGVQKSFKVIVKSCGIAKPVTIHNLRHSYGTHLIEAGLNLRAIQHEMGHESPTTTALYTQLTDTVQQNTSVIINALVDQIGMLMDGRV